MRQQVEELINLGKELLSDHDEIEVEQQVELLDQYTDSFAELVESEDFEQQVAALDQETREALSSLHARVLEFAEQLRDETFKDLKRLKKKGKGIMAYLDHYPQPTNRKPRRRG